MFVSITMLVGACDPILIRWLWPGPWRTGLDATAFNGDTSKERAREILNAVADPEATLQLLYVTPEKFVKSKSLLNKLEKVRQLRHHVGPVLTRMLRCACSSDACCSHVASKIGAVGTVL